MAQLYEADFTLWTPSQNTSFRGIYRQEIATNYPSTDIVSSTLAQNISVGATTLTLADVSKFPIPEPPNPQNRTVVAVINKGGATEEKVFYTAKDISTNTLILAQPTVFSHSVGESVEVEEKVIAQLKNGKQTIFLDDENVIYSPPIQFRAQGYVKQNPLGNPWGVVFFWDDTTASGYVLEAADVLITRVDIALYTYINGSASFTFVSLDPSTIPAVLTIKATIQTFGSSQNILVEYLDINNIWRYAFDKFDNTRTSGRWGLWFRDVGRAPAKIARLEVWSV